MSTTTAELTSVYRRLGQTQAHLVNTFDQPWSRSSYRAGSVRRSAARVSFAAAKVDAALVRAGVSVPPAGVDAVWLEGLVGDLTGGVPPVAVTRARLDRARAPRSGLGLYALDDASWWDRWRFGCDRDRLEFLVALWLHEAASARP